MLVKYWLIDLLLFISRDVNMTRNPTENNFFIFEKYVTSVDSLNLYGL